MGLLKDLRLKILGYTDEEIMGMMSKIKVDKSILKEYKKCVNKNKHLDWRTLEAKLKRNVLVSKDVQTDKNGKERVVYYGNLVILVLDDKVMKVENNFGQPRDFKIDFRLKNRINDLYWL